MSLEAIKKIAAIETETDKQRADALAEAKKIAAGAEAAGRELLLGARESAEADVGKICQKAEAQGQVAAAEITKGIQSECLAMEKAAAAKMGSAVSIIVERVVKG